jgi:regulation of enolase protein 1 (concanavalin A-like superfamily)
MLRAIAALVVLSITVAAAPVPEPWLAGWDEPVDPLGDCRFERDRDKLTITVPGGKHHALDVENGPAPRLLRDVEGDFVVQVRVGGAFSKTFKEADENDKVYQGAGIIITDGKKAIKIERRSCRGTIMDGGSAFFSSTGGRGRNKGPSLDKPAYLWFERRGTQMQCWCSEDGEKWFGMVQGDMLELQSKKLKVGVIAEATTPAEFRPWFDHFLISPPDKDGKPRIKGR